MKDHPKIGKVCDYTSAGWSGTKTMRVRVTGYVRGLVITEGIDDGRRRDVPVSRLELVEETENGG